MKISFPKRPSLSANTLLLLVAAYLVVAVNARFWSIAFEASAGRGISTIGVIIAIGASLLAITVFMLIPLSMRWVFKPGLVAVLLLSAGAAYFVSDYGAVIDRHALASVYETDTREATEWLSLRMLLSIGLLGVLPALLVCWVNVEWRKPLSELWARLKLALLAVLLVGVAALSFGKDIASLVRNHTELRHIANPFALLAANLSYLDHKRNDNRPLQPIGIDAHRSSSLPVSARPVVLVLAIGESARASSFKLGGYDRDTNPELGALPIVYFNQVSSCGTNTATSLPCMFTDLGRKDYEDGVAKYRENLLDVLKRGGYDTIWFDNNTGSKSLAIRTREVTLAKATDPKLCNAEGCHDQILLDALAAELPKIKRDTVIVLHMLGSHGPAYYARYPEAFAKFTPECKTNALQHCTDLQLRNTYDNTILYTDHILAQAAKMLRDDAAIDSAMLFVSDHGESTGEKGLYLHGAPYAIAPKEQTHVPMFVWASASLAERRRLDMKCLGKQRDMSLSHDNLFHSTLGLAGVSTSAYRAPLDLFASCASNSSAAVTKP